MRHALPMMAVLMSSVAFAGSERLTLEQIYHPQQKIKFDTTPLSRLSWDNQNRLVEKVIKDGQVQLFAVNVASGEKTALPVDGNLIDVKSDWHRRQVDDQTC